jgi:hypothetical protein
MHLEELTMRLDPTLSPSYAVDAELLAIHLLKELTTLQREGRRTNVAELARTVGVRRADARAVLSRLHRQGLVDVLHMRPTLAGFAIGASLAGATLPSPRVPRRPARAAA